MRTRMVVSRRSAVSRSTASASRFSSGSSARRASRLRPAWTVTSSPTKSTRASNRSAGTRTVARSRGVVGGSSVFGTRPKASPSPSGASASPRKSEKGSENESRWRASFIGSAIGSAISLGAWAGKRSSANVAGDGSPSDSASPPKTSRRRMRPLASISLNATRHRSSAKMNTSRIALASWSVVSHRSQAR